MSELSSPLPADHFERVYREKADPWRSLTRDSEQRKFKAALQLLPSRRYRAALELGCGIGAFSKVLAARCGTLHAVDCSATAIAQARRNVADQHVDFAVARLPGALPVEDFDLVVLSEVGYYLTAGELDELRLSIEAGLGDGGQLLLVHWLGESKDHRSTANEVHAAFTGPAWFPVAAATVAGERTPHRIDVLEKRSRAS